jgi:predicted MPP superfamily phosphohydrolase
MPDLNINRRKFLRWAGAAAFVGTVGAVGYGGVFEAWDYELTETVVGIRGLPERFEGFRIVQVSDVHHSRLVSIEEVRRVVALANETPSVLEAPTL